MQPTPAIEIDQVTGPYDPAVNGSCAEGHPLNLAGRCEPLNTQEYPLAETAKANDATHVNLFIEAS